MASSLSLRGLGKNFEFSKCGGEPRGSQSGPLFTVTAAVSE